MLDTDDLNANRAGRLGPNQRRRLTQQSRYLASSLGGAAPLTVAVILSRDLVGAEHPNLGRALVLALVAATIELALATMVYLKVLAPLRAALRGGRLEAIEGDVRWSSDRRNRKDVLWIGDRHFATQRRRFAVEDGQHCRAYVLAGRVTMLVGIEPLPTAESRSA